MKTGQQATDIDALNSLLRGELSAVETYTQALEKFDAPLVVSELKTLRGEHTRAARALSEHVSRFGGAPSEGSGAWGAFTAAVNGVAKVIGPSTVLAALREGEEIGIGQYESALGNEDLHPDCHQMVKTELLPACRAHAEKLDALIAGLTA